jgi:adenosylmethionine-8-amino-7-oxononanoate aminotransferase
VAAALSLANLDLMERERLNDRVLKNEAALGATLGKLLDLPIVGDVRGDGYFWAVELVKDKATAAPFDTADRERLVRGFLPGALFDNGLYCRPDDRGDVVIQVAPPLICGQQEFDEMEQILRHTLIEAQQLV